MIYENPIILSDYSDPDVIRRGDSYYMVASSFNHTPGIPVLKSKNLVDWKIINYVYNEIPFKRFNSVCHGDGAWAPSIRFHNHKFYVCIPFPDEGIYVSSCTNIDKGDWTKPWCLIEGKGLEDPCPIWIKDKCYLVVGFAKSRAGINSVLGLFEVSSDLKENISKDYKIIFDGHNTQPTIEGPKFYQYNDYIYIMAPAGSVKTGWQTCLRSKNIYGPYEEKIVLMQNDSKINGPHQGALIDLPNNEFAFIHFQDLGVYGRVVHLQPVKFINDWPICGIIKDELLAGTPYERHDYFIPKKSNYKILVSDEFIDKKLSYMWQTPANIKNDWYKLDGGLHLYCYYHNEASNKALNMTPNSFLTKIVYKSFSIKTLCILKLKNDGDEVGLEFMGNEYAYISVKRINGNNHIQLKSGAFNQENDIVLEDYIYNRDSIEFIMKFKYPGLYQLGFNGEYFKNVFSAKPGRWIGGKYGIYAKGLKNSNGEGIFQYFKVKRF